MAGEPSLPEGFRRVAGGGHWIVFDAAFEKDLDALGALSPDGLDRLLAGGDSPGAHGRGATVRHPLPGAGAELLVRPVLHGGLLGGLLGGSLRSGGRALEELRVTQALREAGAPVPRPALSAARRAGLAWNAVVGTVFERDAPDVLAWLAGEPENERILAAAAACARAVRRFHDAGGRHADLHVKNLLLRETPAGFEAVLVDLDGAAFGEPPDAARRMREIARLYRSGLKRGVAGRLDLEGHRTFLAAYVGDDPALGAALSRHWPRERRRVALHAVRYRDPGERQGDPGER